MYGCVVSLSQNLYVKNLCVLSRYLRCHMLNVCVCCLIISDVTCQMFVCVCCLVISDVIYMAVLSRYLRFYMLNVGVCCLVIPDVIC